MHAMIWRLVKYVLRSFLLLILFFLLIGLSKNHWSVSWYVQFLNNRSRSDVLSQWGVSNIFWSNTWDVVSSTEIDDFVGTGVITWNAPLSAASTGMDAYDPTLEQSLNQLPQDTLPSGDSGPQTTGFGFVSSGATGAVPSSASASTLSWDSKAQLLDIIKKREMNK